MPCKGLPGRLPASLHLVTGTTTCENIQKMRLGPQQRPGAAGNTWPWGTAWIRGSSGDCLQEGESVFAKGWEDNWEVWAAPVSTAPWDSQAHHSTPCFFTGTEHPFIRDLLLLLDFFKRTQTFCYPESVPAKPTYHCKSREQSRGSAGGFQLGSAQVQLPPGQGLNRVVVGGHQLQVAAAHPVPIIHALGARLRAASRSGGIHRDVQFRTHHEGSTEEIKQPRSGGGSGRDELLEKLCWNKATLSQQGNDALNHLPAKTDQENQVGLHKETWNCCSTVREVARHPTLHVKANISTFPFHSSPLICFT